MALSVKTYIFLCLAVCAFAAPNLLEGDHNHNHNHNHNHADPHNHEAPQSETFYIPQAREEPLPDIHQHEHEHAPAESEEETKPEYAFIVEVKEGDTDFVIQENRDGDLTEGSYQVLLPDTRVQKVTYTVNAESGYVADVTYEGEAKFDEVKPVEAA